MKLSLVTAVLGVAVAACASDQVLAWQDIPDADPPNTIPDSGDAPDASTETCGNGAIEAGEECDDGNVTGGDGCSATCKFEKPASACPGTPFPLTGTADSRTGSVTGDTSEAKPTLESTTCGGGNGKDVVYALKSDVAGRAVVRLSAEWAALLSVRKACDNPASETSCKPVPATGGKTELAVPLAANETVFLIVDGIGGQSGEFKLDVSVSPTFCGDGIAIYPEQCDDGNTTNGDGCSATCTLEGGNPGAGVCPGIGLQFVGDPNQPKHISLAGDLTLLKNTMSCFSGSDSGGPDQAYAITPTIDGAITAVLTASYARATLHLRRECFSASTHRWNCRMELSPTTPVRLTFPVSANQTYSLFVDSKSNTSGPPLGGPYTLDLTLAPATCGNGVLESPEQCDDGNMTAGDGCSPTCTLEPFPDGIDTCPGALIPFSGDVANGPLTYRTTASTAVLTPGARSCAATTATRKDAVYRLVSPFDGYVTIKAKGDFNVGLGLRTACLAESETYPSSSSDPRYADNVACATAYNNNEEETLAVAVTAGRPYYLVVEGEQQNANFEGVFALDVLLEKSVCGNGRLEGGEACDDGNTIDGDTCSSTCTIEPLGNPSRDTCDSAEDLVLTLDAATGAYKTRVTGGNWNLSNAGSFAAPCGATTGRDAFFKVVPPIDGVLVVDVDATYNVTPGLRNACPPSTGAAFLTCSNRTSGPGGERFSYPVTKATPYWIIVDAANAATDRGAFTLDVSLKSEDCGDGVVGGTEECDDGNLVSGDGCSATCRLEPLAGANTCPGYPVSLAGAGNEVRRTSVTLSTANLSASYAGTCGGNARDGVIAVTSDITGTMNAQLEGVWASVLYARGSCTDSSSQLGCSAFNPTTPHRTLRDLSFDVIAGVPTYLFIDGLGGATGPATLFITVTP